MEQSEVLSAEGADLLRALPAAQQPQWRHHSKYHQVQRRLLDSEPLVTVAELHALTEQLTTVATGHAELLQLGDCAESFSECTPSHISEKVDLLESLGDFLTARTYRPVIRVGRLGGQFAKPRSKPTEKRGNGELPVFRGHMINSELPTNAARQHDPRRMLWAYEASAKVMSWLRAHRDVREARTAPLGPWSSHEALVLDYEGALIRRDSDTDELFLGSTHLPWIGERTRDPDAAHARLFAAVRNPVACKVGPNVKVADLVRLCGWLDPDREPGRLTLISRMGRDRVRTALPEIVSAVGRAGHPVTWVCDPMHGNTVCSPVGLKTRYLTDMIAELEAFRAVLEAHGRPPGGLHLEVATSDVTECVGGGVRDDRDLVTRYTSLCDPRLNPEQAQRVLEAWAR